LRRPSAPPCAFLLQLHGGPRLLEFLLELVALLLVDALLHRLGRLIDQRLGLFEPQAGGGPHDLDHLDLLVARCGQDHVHGARFFRLLAGAVAARAARGSRNRCRYGRSRHAELLLERFYPLGQLEHRDALELLDPLLRRCCHVSPPWGNPPRHRAFAAPTRRPCCHLLAQALPPPQLGSPERPRRPAPRLPGPRPPPLEPRHRPRAPRRRGARPPRGAPRRPAGAPRPRSRPRRRGAPRRPLAPPRRRPLAPPRRGPQPRRGWPRPRRQGAPRRPRAPPRQGPRPRR